MPYMLAASVMFIVFLIASAIFGWNTKNVNSKYFYLIRNVSLAVMSVSAIFVLWFFGLHSNWFL